ncbi:MAG: hypothetical protein UU16_C0031G0001, partial [Candidatus Woesebacteria bacterium GW2011_GWA2_40_7]
AVRGIASIAEKTDLSYALSELDKKPKVPNQLDETVFKGLSESEREKIKTYYETALTEKFLAGLHGVESVADYPKTMLKGLVAVRNGVYAIEGDEANDPKKIFCQKYISPLIEYLEYRLATADRSELAVESLINYDFVLNIMHFQSDILVGPQKEANHEGILIPITEFQGAQSGSTTIFLSDKKLTIHSKMGTFEYPLPERNVNGEVAIKGGLARVVAKILFNLSADAELPLSDLDLVTFGKIDHEFELNVLKDKYGVDPKDVERINSTGPTGYTLYLGDRDQTLNEVLFTKDGLVISLNALASYLQESSQVSADPVRNIFGTHVINIGANYLLEGAGPVDFFYVRETRFPTPRALSRMYMSLISGKVDTLVIPRGSLKMDVGIYWLVLARKLLKIENIEKKDNLLKRMLELADQVDSPYYAAMHDKDNPLEFVEKVKSMAPGGSEFDMDGGDLGEKETLDWLAGRLVKQIMGKVSKFVGYDSVKSFEKKLKPEDLDAIQVLLPRPESYPDFVEDPVKKDEHEVFLIDRTKAFYEAFDEAMPGVEIIKKQAQDFLEQNVPLGVDYKGCELYIVSEADADRFFRAGVRIGELDPEYEPKGLYRANTNIAFAILKNDQKFVLDDLDRLFEELFHSTGRHFIEFNGEKRFVRAFQNSFDYDNPDVKVRGRFLEEALSSITYYNFLYKERFIGQADSPMSYLNAAGLPLRMLIEKTGTKKHGLYDNLMLARIGDQKAEDEAKKVIDGKFGVGFFDYLMTLNPNDVVELTKLYSRLGLKAEFALKN